MATVKVAQLRATLDAFAALYERCGATDDADALRALSKAMQKADKRTVDDVVGRLNQAGDKPPSTAKVSSRH